MSSPSERPAYRAKLLIGVAAGLLGIGLAFWGVDLTEIASAFAALQSAWLIPIGAIFLLQQVFRAWRQKILLEGALPGLRFRDSYAILCVSFFFINTLPARLGEVLRPLLLLEREALPLGSGFGMVFLERAIDFVAVLAMLAIVLALAPLPSGELVIGGQSFAPAQILRTLSLGTLPILLLLPVILALFPGSVLRLSGSVAFLLERRFPVALVGRLARLALTFAETFVASFQVVRSPLILSKVLLLTVITWSMSAWMYVMLAHALGIGAYIHYIEGMGVLVFTMLGMALPSPPGFAGVYEAFGRGALALFGVRGAGLDGIAVAFVLIIHWWQYGVQSITALYFLYRDGLGFSRLTRLAMEQGRRLTRARVGE